MPELNSAVLSRVMRPEKGRALTQASVKETAKAVPHSSDTAVHSTKDSAKQVDKPIEATTEAARDENLKALAELVTGTQSIDLANLLVRQVGNVQNNICACGDPKNTVKTVAASMAEMKPRNFLEATLIAQMLQTHHGVAEFLQRATHPEQTIDAADRNVNRAVRLGRLFTEQVEALQKLRGQSGHQKVVVEHVNVAPGAQAIVGTVTGNGQGGGLK